MSLKLQNAFEFEPLLPIAYCQLTVGRLPINPYFCPRLYNYFRCPILRQNPQARPPGFRKTPTSTGMSLCTLFASLS